MLRELTLLVDDETARQYEHAPELVRERVKAAVVEVVRSSTFSARELLNLMDKVGEEARARGMTEEIADEILRRLDAES